MAGDEVTLRCKIIDEAPDKALIQTDVGQAWIYRSDFSIAKLGWASSPTKYDFRDVSGSREEYSNPNRSSGNAARSVSGRDADPFASR
jgi:hypothetical protein